MENCKHSSSISFHTPGYPACLTLRSSDTLSIELDREKWARFLSIERNGFGFSRSSSIERSGDPECSKTRVKLHVHIPRFPKPSPFLSIELDRGRCAVGFHGLAVSDWPWDLQYVPPERCPGGLVGVAMELYLQLSWGLLAES